MDHKNRWQLLSSKMYFVCEEEKHCLFENMSDDFLIVKPAFPYHVPASVWIFESKTADPTIHAFGFFHLLLLTFLCSLLFCILRQGCVAPNTAVAVPLLEGDRVVSSKGLDEA